MAEGKSSSSFLSQLQNRSNHLKQQLDEATLQLKSNPTEEAKENKNEYSFCLQETNKIIELYTVWQAKQAESTAKAATQNKKGSRLLGKLLTLVEALNSQEQVDRLKNDNPKDAQNIAYVLSFINQYFPANYQVTNEELADIRTEFSTIVISGSYGAEWDAKKLDRAAEITYKLIKDTPATELALKYMKEAQAKRPIKLAEYKRAVQDRREQMQKMGWDSAYVRSQQGRYETDVNIVLKIKEIILE